VAILLTTVQFFLLTWRIICTSLLNLFHCPCLPLLFKLLALITHAKTIALARACHQNVVQLSSRRVSTLPCEIKKQEQLTIIDSKLHGSRSQGGQKKHFSDHVKAILKKCNIPADQLESLAADRSTWRDTCLDIVLILITPAGCRGSSYSPACRCRFNTKRPVLPCMQSCVRL